MRDRRGSFGSGIRSLVASCLSRRYFEVRAAVQFPLREMVRPTGEDSAGIPPIGCLASNFRNADWFRRPVVIHGARRAPGRRWVVTNTLRTGTSRLLARSYPNVAKVLRGLRSALERERNLLPDFARRQESNVCSTLQSAPEETGANHRFLTQVGETIRPGETLLNPSHHVVQSLLAPGDADEKIPPESQKIRVHLLRPVQRNRLL